MPKRLSKLRPDLSSSGWDLLRAFTSRYLRAGAKLLQEHVVCNSAFSLALVLGYGVAVRVMFLLQGTALCVIKLFGLAGSHRGWFSVRCLQGVVLACSSWVLHILNNTWTSGALLGFKTWHLIVWLLKKKVIKCMHVFSAFLGTVSLALCFHVAPLFNFALLIGWSTVGLAPGAESISFGCRIKEQHQQEWKFNPNGFGVKCGDKASGKKEV